MLQTTHDSNLPQCFLVPSLSAPSQPPYAMTTELQYRRQWTSISAHLSGNEVLNVSFISVAELHPDLYPLQLQSPWGRGRGHHIGGLRLLASQEHTSLCSAVVQNSGYLHQ